MSTDLDAACQSLRAAILERMFEQGPVERRCSFPECKRPDYAKGLCRSHHQQHRPENLELWARGMQPPGSRVSDLVDAALNVLKLYRPDLLVESVLDEKSSRIDP